MTGLQDQVGALAVGRAASLVAVDTAGRLTASVIGAN
jgi:imidazolonepropionase-like amidohydrolase